MTRLIPNATRRRLASEDGSVMIAVIVLMIVVTLAAAVVASAVQTNQSTRRDANYKAASEAAEAGLQVALYRMNMLNLQSTYVGCLGDGLLTAPNDGNWCESSTTSLGNNTTYQYFTTPVLGTSNTCAGLPIDGSDITQRCITAVGTANGITARSQIRIAAFTAQPLFPANGVIGLNAVTESGNAAVVGTSASNINVTLTGNATTSGIVLGPGGKYSLSGNASDNNSEGCFGSCNSPITLGPVNPGNSATSNSDYRITNALNGSCGTGSSCDAVSSNGVSFNSSTRVLSISGNGSLTLGGGVYNFCELDISGKGSLAIAAGVESEIFIDSPDDPGSGCANNTGNVNLSGQSAVNPSQNPLSMQLYVYGLNNGKGTVKVSGQGNVYAVVYAPNSDVQLSGNGIVAGAVAGRTVEISGNGFNFDQRTTTLQASTTGLFYRTAWAQCSPQPTTSDAGSGCG